jgi:hypothetical protein
MIMHAGTRQSILHNLELNNRQKIPSLHISAQFFEPYVVA